MRTGISLTVFLSDLRRFEAFVEIRDCGAVSSPAMGRSFRLLVESARRDGIYSSFPLEQSFRHFLGAGQSRLGEHHRLHFAHVIIVRAALVEALSYFPGADAVVGLAGVVVRHDPSPTGGQGVMKRRLPRIANEFRGGPAMPSRADDNFAVQWQSLAPNRNGGEKR